MPIRGLAIDPSRRLDEQRIGTTVQMPYKWLEVLGDVARNAGVSKSRVMCEAWSDFCKKHKIDLPPCQ